MESNIPSGYDDEGHNTGSGLPSKDDYELHDDEELLKENKCPECGDYKREDQKELHKKQRKNAKIKLLKVHVKNLSKKRSEIRIKKSHKIIISKLFFPHNTLFAMLKTLEKMTLVIFRQSS